MDIRRSDRELTEMRQRARHWRECARRCVQAGDPDRSEREFREAESIEAAIRRENDLRARENRHA